MKLKLALYFLHQFFGSLDFARALFVLFLVDRGLNMSEVGVLQTLLFWSNIFFEIPAGLLADKIKRKYSVSIGLIGIALSAFLMPFASSFWLFALVFVLHGMGFAFRSGADTALLYDELQEAGPKWSKKFLAMSARSRSIATIALVLAMASGGFIQGEFGWIVVYSVFGISMLLAALCVLLIKEGEHKHNDELDSALPFKGIIGASKTFLNSSQGRLLALFIVAMGFIEATHAPMFIYIQSYFRSFGLDESTISLIIGLSMGLTSIAYLFVEKFKSISLSKIVLVGCFLLTLLVALFLSSPPLAVAIGLFAVVDLLPAILFVYTDNYINEKIPSNIRASVLSVHSFISSVFISLTFLGAGRMLDLYKPELVLGWLFVLPALGFVSLFVYFNHEKRVLRSMEAKQ